MKVAALVMRLGVLHERICRITYAGWSAEKLKDYERQGAMRYGALSRPRRTTGYREDYSCVGTFRPPAVLLEGAPASLSRFKPSGSRSCDACSSDL